MDDKKNSNFEIISFDDFFKGAKKSTKLNKIEEGLVRYFNSNEAIRESYLETSRNYNNILNQVVGAKTA